MEPEIELVELRRFLAVTEERSFRRAAERLGISQPTLSRSIAALEVKVGARLFVRTTRTIVPTTAGVVLADQAKRVIEAAAAAVRRTARAARRERSIGVATKAG